MTPLLHTLNISGCNISPEFLKAIVVQLPQLTNLDISGNPLVSHSLNELSGLDHLTQLSLRASSSYLLSYSIGALQCLPSLKILDISGNGFQPDEAVKALEFLIDRLSRLVINKGTSITYGASVIYNVNPITADQIRALREKAPHVQIISDIDASSTSQI